MSISDYEERQRERNQKILEERVAHYNEKEGVRVGDWIREKDGKMTRATYIWWDGQVQNGGHEYGAFYLGDGYISYSGSLDEGYKKEQLRETDEMKDGLIWFFKNDIWMAHNGIEYKVPFRVFEVVEC